MSAREAPNIPNGWGTCTLESATSELFVDGDWILKPDLASGTDVRLIQLGDIGIGKFLDKSSKWIGKDRCEELGCTLLEAGDILISRMAEPIARACVVPPLGYPAITAVDVSILRPDTELFNPEFLLMQLNSDFFRIQAEAQAAGTTRKRITRKKLGLLTLLVPPRAAQDAIVAGVKAQLDEINSAESEVRAITDLSQSLFVSRYREAFTGMANWDWTTLGDLAGTVTSGSRDWKPYYHQGSGVFILTQNVRMGRLDLSEPFYIGPPADDPAAKRSRVQRDDILLNIVGSVGALVRVTDDLTDHYVCQSVALVRLKDPTLSAYVEAYLAAPSGGQAFFGEKTYGLGRPHLSFADIKATPVPIPPLELREQIVTTVERIRRDHNEMLAVPLALSPQANGLRASLVRSALSGSIQVSNADGADEDGIALLQRVLSRRNGAAPAKKRRARAKTV